MMTLVGRLFHTRGAAAPNARSPIVQSRVRRTSSLRVAITIQCNDTLLKTCLDAPAMSVFAQLDFTEPVYDDDKRVNYKYESTMITLRIMLTVQSS